MNAQAYLIDTNVVIGLEDNHPVNPVFSNFLALAAKHKVDIFVHAAAQDDISRDKNIVRREISNSKLKKFQTLGKVSGLTKDKLENMFGKLKKPNDHVDAILLHALIIGVVDFLVTEDRGLHDRAQRHSTELARRVLFVADAASLLSTTYQPKETCVRYVEEVSAHSIDIEDTIFDSLREGYPEFNVWWREKCVAQRRLCWVVSDEGLAGLIVRKDEKLGATDATSLAKKILKVCTFKVRPESRGIKIGELLLKQLFWYAQINRYDLVYLTTYENQAALINLIEYYGFINTTTKKNGELVYEKSFSRKNLTVSGVKESEIFGLFCKNYPRFSISPAVKVFGVPIKEAYHDILFPDLINIQQLSLFDTEIGLQKPGNTIRKVYLCRAPSNLDSPGSILFFYKGLSEKLPSQALTAIGVLEDVGKSENTKELMQLCGGRSVYSEKQLHDWRASPKEPVKVINFLLVGYIKPEIGIEFLKEQGIFKKNPPQSIFRISEKYLEKIVPKIKLGFEL
jgi:GNAT superfamily N-acetyltransferase